MFPEETDTLGVMPALVNLPPVMLLCAVLLGLHLSGREELL